MSQFFSDEAITQAMINGLKEGMKQELRERILTQLEADIEDVVASVVQRIQSNAWLLQTPYDMDKKIMLEVLFKHTTENKLVHEHTMKVVKEN